jgi:cyclic beta-1,2-glucan synthetase
MYMMRKPRLADDEALHAVHFLATCDDSSAVVRASADRSRWIGRLGSAATPEFAFAEDSSPTPDGDMATGLDPASVICVQLRLPPGARRCLSFALACAPDADTLFGLVDRYRQPTGVSRALELSETLARIRLRELRLDAEHWSAWLLLNTLLASASTRPLAQTDTAIDRQLLWRHGIAGDRPLLAVWLPSADGVEVVSRLASMLPLWSAGGLALDLVVINAEPASYLSPAQHALAPVLEQVVRHEDAQVPEHRRARLHVLPARELAPAEAATLAALARLSLHADGRSLTQLLERLRAGHEDDRERRERVRRQPVRWPAAATDPRAPQGTFGEHAAYRFEITPQRLPPRPWVNVLANARFGCQVSESAAGFTWAGNSRLQQITAWSNDALCDPPSELLLLQDVDSGAVWPLGRGLTDAPREVVHGIGSTRLRETIDGLRIELCWCVDAELSLKQLQLHIDSDAATPRRLRVVAFAEWTLGGARFDRASVVTRVQRGPSGAGGAPGRQLLLATQADAGVMPAGSTAFLGWRTGTDTPNASADAEDWSCDRREFFDAHGRWVLPERLQKRAGGGLDACAALGCRLQVSARHGAAATLLLGNADSIDAAQRLAEQAWAVDPAVRLQQQRAIWPALLDAIEVRTPDSAFDALVNRWLPYQSIACRLWARAGFYQAGGAFGFRDQLQDAMGVADRAPELLRAQIVLHAAHQFEEGDVQHWWHPPSGAGVRTHISDDLLWLPLALVHHLSRQGDAELLDEVVPFLHGPPVPEGREDLYNTPAAGEQRGSLYEHAARAIDHSLASGAHGLPLMGSGDWNDGMNRVGHLGRGESVWLGWFLCHVIEGFAPIAELRGE